MKKENLYEAILNADAVILDHDALVYPSEELNEAGDGNVIRVSLDPYDGVYDEFSREQIENATIEGDTITLYGTNVCDDGQQVSEDNIYTLQLLERKNLEHDMKNDITALHSLCRIKYGNIDKDVDEFLTIMEQRYGI